MDSLLHHDETKFYQEKALFWFPKSLLRQRYMRNISYAFFIVDYEILSCDDDIQKTTLTTTPPSSSIFKRLASVIRTNIHYYHFLDFLSLVFIFLTYCMHNNHLTDSLLNIFVIFSLYLCCLLEWLRVTIMLWSAIKYNNVAAIKFVSYFSYIYNT